MTAVPAASGSTPVAARAAVLSDSSAAPESGIAFAGLLEPGTAASAPVEATARADGDAEPGTATDTDTDTDTGASPTPLLGWLFGLMASTGRAAPGAGSPLPPATGGTTPAAALATPAQAVAVADGDAAVVAANIAGVADAADTQTPHARSGRPSAPAEIHVSGRIPAMERAAQPAAESNGVPALSDIVARQMPARPDADEARGTAPSAVSEGARLVPTLLQDLHATLQADRTAIAAPTSQTAPLDTLAATFVDDLGERIEWQLAEGLSEASIELHPAELGSITVRVEVQGDQARVHMVAAEAATRALLTQAMPQLRELLTGSGLNLARSHVEAETRGSGRSPGREGDVRVDGTVRRRVTEVLLVDAYA